MYSNCGNNRRRPNPTHQNQNQNPPNSKRSTVSDFCIQDLFKGKHLDIVAAALLLSGRLKVDSVELFRGSPVVAVSLLGKYIINEKEKANALAEFLEENGDLTLDDVFEAFQSRMEKENKK